MAKTLLDHGANSNSAYKEGWTVLMQAATDGSEPLVKLLVAHGAAITARDKDGAMAVVEAREQGHREVADYLQSVHG
ncbi:MAG: ankyrin repeat domain-containing protein [Janthinobacterium lividum]